MGSIPGKWMCYYKIIILVDSTLYVGSDNLESNYLISRYFLFFIYFTKKKKK
jgi:hypothetical protein